MLERVGVNKSMLTYYKDQEQGRKKMMQNDTCMKRILFCDNIRPFGL